MARLSTPIENFVPLIIHRKSVNKIIGEWRLEESVISNVIIAHFRSMGIFHCENSHTKMLIDVIIFQLKNSPQLARMVKNANIDEEEKRRSAFP